MKKNKIIFSILLILLVCLSIIITLYLIQHNQDEESENKNKPIIEETYTKPSIPYGYDGLNEWQQELYDVLEKSNLQIGFQYDLGEERNIDDVKVVMELFKVNNIDTQDYKSFAISENTIPSPDGIGVVLTNTTQEIRITHYMYQDYKLDKEELDEVNKKADEIINNLINENDTYYEKLYKIYSYLIENAKYDFETYKIMISDGNRTQEQIRKIELASSAYGALINGKAVCTGLSKAFHMLAKKAGIYVLYVESNKIAHAWNVVWLDNEYYVIDITGSRFLTSNNYKADPIGNIEMPDTLKDYPVKKRSSKY